MITRILKQMIVINMMVICFMVFSCTRSECPTDQVNRMLSAAIDMEDSDAVMALDLYEEAYDILMEHPDSQLLRETHFRKGLLFLRNALPEECVVSLRETARLDSLLRDTVSWHKTMRSIAFAYESHGQFEQARTVLKEVMMSMPASEDNIRVRMDMDYYTRYDELQNMQKELPETYVHDMDRLTPKSTELDVAFRGWQAEQEQNYDYAIFQYKKLENKHSYYVRAFGQLHTARLQMLLGRYDEASQSLDAYEETNGLIRKSEQTTKMLLQHHASFQDRRARREIDRLSLLNRQQWQMIISVTIASLLVIMMLLLLLRVYRQRQVILKFRIDKMRQWREEYLNRSGHAQQRVSEDALLSDVIQRLRRKLNGGDDKTMTDDDWEALHTAVLSAYPTFKRRLADLCRLSAHDYHVCLLIKIDVKPSDIARITIRSDEAITSTRRRLYERAFGRKGKPSDWDEVIKML